MASCEASGVEYLFGSAGNARPVGAIGAELMQARIRAPEPLQAAGDTSLHPVAQSRFAAETASSILVLAG